MATSKEQSPEVRVDGENRQARLFIPAGFPRDQLTAGFLKVLIDDRGVEYTRAVERAIADLIADPPEPDDEAEIVLAEATEPEHGEPGRVEWLVEEPDEQPEELSFYERSPYVMVESGQKIGKVHPPSMGVDGRDVLGNTKPAKPGKAAPWKFHDTIELKPASGELFAQTDGMLVRANGKAQISQMLEINGTVDFSTGHVDFDGDVLVTGSVRDRFEVRATGNVEVRHLVESANIICAGDLIAVGGVAAREQGRLEVKGDLIARHLNSVEGQVQGNLCVEREMFNCTFEIAGEVHVPGGTILAGELTCGGHLEAAVLGSDGERQTDITLGQVSSLQRRLAHLERVINQSQKMRSAVRKQLAALKDPDQADNADTRERQTELMFQLHQIEQALEKARSAHGPLKRSIKKRSVIDVAVSKMIHPNVRFRVGPRRYKITQPLRGPVTLQRDEEGHPVIQQGNGPRTPLRDLADVELIEGQAEADDSDSRTNRADRRDGAKQTRGAATRVQPEAA